MNDPLRIFTKDQLEILNDYHLRRLKKEFFSPITFGGKTSVVLNNHEVDKATLEAIFTELEANLDTYLFKIDNKALADFLENGNLSFLYNDQQYNEVVDLIKTNPKLEFKVAAKLNTFIADILKKLNGNTLNVLHVLLGFTSEFQASNQELAYQKSYEDLDEFTKDLWSTFPTPFQNTKDFEYRSEIGRTVNLHKARTFDYLPESFEKLDISYSQWCVEIIVKNSISRLHDLKHHKKRDLKIFIEASNIASRHFKTEKIQYYIKSATNVLKGDGRNKSGWSVLFIFLGIFSFIRIIIMFANMSDANSKGSSSRSYRQQDREIAEAYKKALKNHHETLLREPELKKKDSGNKNSASETSTSNDKINTAKNKKPSKFTVDKSKIKQEKINTPNFKGNHSDLHLSKNYSGEQSLLLKAKLTHSKSIGDTIQLHFDSELIPMSDLNFHQLLPTKTQEEDAGKPTVALMSFTNKDLNIKTRHLVDIIYNTDNQPSTTMYNSKKSGNGDKMVLSAKRIPFSEFDVKGLILLKETKSGKAKEKIQFNIKYDSTKKVYKVKYGNNKKLELSFEDVKRPYLMKGEGIISKKFATITNNLGLLHKKYLKEKNYYKMAGVCKYRLIVDEKLTENASQFGAKNGNLRYKFTSKVDDYAYCELNTKNTAIKYIFDQKTGILKGMIRATTSYTKNEVEQVIVFRQ